MKLQFLLLCATMVVQFYESNGCFKDEKKALLDFKEFLKSHNDFIQPYLLGFMTQTVTVIAGSVSRVTLLLVM